MNAQVTDAAVIAAEIAHVRSLAPEALAGGVPPAI